MMTGKKTDNDNIENGKMGFSTIVIIMLLFLVLPLMFEINIVFVKNTVIGFQFVLIGAISSIMIINEKKYGNYSITMINYLFFYFFVFLAGSCQYINDRFCYNLNPTDGEIIHANFLIIIWIVIFSVYSRLGRRKIFRTKHTMNFGVQIFQIGVQSRLVLIGICLSIGIALIVTRGPSILFNRYAYSVASAVSSTTLTMLLVVLRNGLGIWTLYLCSYEYIGKKSALNLSILVLAFAACTLIIPPLATSRTIVLVTYVGAILILSGRIKKHFNFLLLVIIAQVFAAPFMNLFRAGYTAQAYNALKFITKDIKGNFLIADYDAYSMFIGTIRLVKNYDVSMGSQLLGVIFFFVPRSIWPTKPVGSGAYVMGNLNTHNVTNISCPIFGEAYINFGVIGIILFSAFLGYWFARIDSIYWESKERKGLIYYIYPFLVLFALMINRGDLMNAFSWVLGYSLVYWIISTIFARRIFLSKIERQDIC